MFAFLRRSSPLWSAANFNRLWAAQILSAFGSRITRTAIPIIAVSALSVSPWQAALLAALTYAPYVLAGALGGGFIERGNKTRIMVAMDLIRFAIVIATPIAWLLNLLSFPLLCVLAAGAGAASALFQNADVAILPRLVGKEQLVDANARLQGTESLAELTAPGIAGILIDLLTAPIAMIADAVTFVWSAFWLWKIPRQAGETKAEEAARVQPQVPRAQQIRQDIAIGFRAIWECRPVRAIITATFFWYVSAGFFFATFTLFMLRVLGMSPTLMGVIISVGGAAALVGSVLARPLSRAISYGPAIVTAFVVSVLGILMLIPAAAFPQWAVFFMVLQQLLGDSGIMMFTILAVSLQQRLLPEDQLARANGFNQVVNGIAMTASILVAGWIAETAGIASTVIMGSGISLFGVLPLISPHVLGVKEKLQGSAEAVASARC